MPDNMRNREAGREIMMSAIDIGLTLVSLEHWSLTCLMATQ